MPSADEPLWPDVDENLIAPMERAKKVFDTRVDVVAAHRAAVAGLASETHKSDLSRAAAQEAARTAAEIEETKAAAVALRSTVSASRAADLTNLQSFYDGLSALAIGSVERARAGAEVVQKASAAIVTLYTGLLGFVFVASDNPLPTRGVLAPVFLGLAVVLSTAYLAYVADNDDTTSGPTPARGVEPKVIARLNATVAAASRVATRRSYLLRAGVMALGVGLVYIALPFLSLGSPAPATPTSTPSLAAWPTPSAGIPDALNEIVFKAQVAEVATSRATATAAAVNSSPPDDTTLLIGLALGGLAATFVVPLIWASGTRDRRSTTDHPLDM